MAGLPRSIIKQYGVSKKAWAVYRGQKTVRRSNSRGATSMARKRSSGRRSSGGGMSGKMMNGFYRPTGILQSVVLGVGAASLSRQIPIQMPYKEEIAAGVVGGVPGAAAVYFLKRMGGGSASSSNASDLVSGY